MAKNIHIAIMPDGSIAKRESASRVYVSCLAFRWSRPWDEAKARDVEGRCDVSNYGYYLPRAAGDLEALQHAPDVEAAIAEAKAKLMGAVSVEDFIAKSIAARLVRIEAKAAEGFYEAWNVEGWQGRPSLAQAALNRDCPWMAEKRIIPAELQAPKAKKAA